MIMRRKVGVKVRPGSHMHGKEHVKNYVSAGLCLISLGSFCISIMRAYLEDVGRPHQQLEPYHSHAPHVVRPRALHLRTNRQ